MKPIKFTATILAYKSLNRDIDKNWIDWAVDMLMEGFDTEYLVILPGISPAYEQPKTIILYFECSPCLKVPNWLLKIFCSSVNQKASNHMKGFLNVLTHFLRGEWEPTRTLGRYFGCCKGNYQ